MASLKTLDDSSVAHRPTPAISAVSPSSPSESPLVDRSHPIEILPRFYIGNLRASKNREALEKLGITHVLTIANDIAPEFPKRYKYKVINVDDSTEDDLSQHFDACFSYIDKGRRAGGVLMHCHVGISRSPSVAIAYLMWKENHSYDEAYSWVKEKDALIEPNAGFVQQLKQLEKRIRSARHSDSDSDSD